ncbi:phage tail assembly chaperone [Sphingomonas sp.]
MVLGWGPDVFWSSTPAELAALTAVLGGDAPVAIDGRGLAALMREFPDA